MMTVRFGDLYEEMLTLEEAIERMRIDIANADCDFATRCILMDELENLEYKYIVLQATDFDFEKLNFLTVVESIERCMHCIEFDGSFTDLAPAPTGVASTCGNKKYRLSLDDIEEVTIYEVSKTATPDTYNFVKSAMPYRKLTSVNEPMVITWDSLRKGLSVRGYPSATGEGFAEIAAVTVTLNDRSAKKYGKKTVRACKVLLTTPTPANSSHPLTHSVDGSNTTFTSFPSTTKGIIELVFQFFV